MINKVVAKLLRTGDLTGRTVVSDNMRLAVTGKNRVMARRFCSRFVGVANTNVAVKLMVCVFFFTGSGRLGTLNGLKVVPTLFKVGRPVLFNTPIIVGPVLTVPFVKVPIVTYLVRCFTLCAKVYPLCKTARVP